MPGAACVHPVLYTMMAQAATIAAAMATLGNVLGMVLLGYVFAVGIIEESREGGACLADCLLQASCSHAHRVQGCPSGRGCVLLECPNRLEFFHREAQRVIHASQPLIDFCVLLHGS